MNILPLEDTNVTAIFDGTTGYIHVKYFETLTPAITTSFYQWLFGVADKIGIKAVRGSTIDFRKVKTFHQGNIRTAQKESRSANQQLDLSHIPVGLIVTTVYQEQMVRISTKLTQQTQRMRIVKSEEEALAFIQEWNQQHTATL